LHQKVQTSASEDPLPGQNPLTANVFYGQQPLQSFQINDTKKAIKVEVEKRNSHSLQTYQINDYAKNNEDENGSITSR